MYKRQLQVEGFTNEIKQIRHEHRLIVKAVLLNVLRMTIQLTLPFVIARSLGSVSYTHLDVYKRQYER